MEIQPGRRWSAVVSGGIAPWLAGAAVGLLLWVLKTDPPLLALLAGRIIQAGAEEIAIRGWLLGQFTRRGQSALGVAVSTAVFVAIHALNPGFSLGAALGLVIFSIVVSMSVLRTNTIWWAWGFHAAWNLGADLWL